MLLLLQAAFYKTANPLLEKYFLDFLHMHGYLNVTTVTASFAAPVDDGGSCSPDMALGTSASNPVYVHVILEAKLTTAQADAVYQATGYYAHAYRGERGKAALNASTCPCVVLEVSRDVQCICACLGLYPLEAQTCYFPGSCGISQRVCVLRVDQPSLSKELSLALRCGKVCLFMGVLR